MNRHDYRWECAVDVRDYVAQYERAYGYPPSIRDIAAGLGISSSSVANLHITWALEFGLLVRTPGVARSLHLPRAES